MSQERRVNRRAMISAIGGAALMTGMERSSMTSVAQVPTPAFSYPMGRPGDAIGDGLLVRHGYATENTWFFPGYWHTGEDWYLPEGDTAGMEVYAVASGVVIFAGSEYPGLVVIVQHADNLFSMYGHLDYALVIESGQPVERGQLLGTVLARTDGRAPSHLHFELRTFFTTPEVNGATPRYGFSCGVECPPGPGYWPIEAPEHPSEMGWRNPTHVINRRAWPDGVPDGAEVVVAGAVPRSAPLWTLPPGFAGGERTGTLELSPGDRYQLLAIDAGEEASTGTSAEAYRLWYQIVLPSGEDGWVQAALPTNTDAGADGRPSSFALSLCPAIPVPQSQ